MTWEVQFTARAQADLDSMQPADQKAVLQGIYRHARTGQGDLKKLQGQRPPRWRLRVGKWRVIHSRDISKAQSSLVIFAVVDRKDAY